MGVLAEYVKQKAAQLRDEQQRVNEAGREWKEAVGRLYARLQGWVAAADGGEGLLRAHGCSG